MSIKKDRNKECINSGVGNYSNYNEKFTDRLKSRFGLEVRSSKLEKRPVEII